MPPGDGSTPGPVVPHYVFIIRIVQAGLAVLLLALVCYPANWWTTAATNAPDAIAFNIFTSVWTFIVLAYALYVPLKFPKYWNKWASLGLEVVTWIFWLTSFAIMADFVRKTSYYGKNNYGSGLYRRSAEPLDFKKLNINELVEDSISNYGSGGSGGSGGGGSFGLKSGVTPWWALCAVATALGAIGWVLWTFTLYTYATALKNEHQSGVEGQSVGTEKYGKTGDVELNQQSFSTAPQ